MSLYLKKKSGYCQLFKKLKVKAKQKRGCKNILKQRHCTHIVGDYCRLTPAL